MESNLINKSKLLIYIKAKQDNTPNIALLKRIDPLRKLKEEIEAGTFDFQIPKKEEPK